MIALSYKDIGALEAKCHNTIFWMAAFSILLSYLLLSGILGEASWYSAVMQGKDIVVTFTIPVILAFFVKQRLLDYRSFLDLVTFGVVISSLMKIFILVYAYMLSISAADIVNSISLFFGVKLMTCELIPGEQSLTRIQFVSDFILPFVIFKMTKYPRLFGVSSMLLFFIISLSVMLSFSRYMWAFSVVALIFGLIVNISDCKSNFRTFLSLMVLMIVVGLGVGFLGYKVLHLRFSQEVIEGSDSVREIQLKKLLDWFINKPIFGHGLGSHVPDLVRSELRDYSYELQLVALSGQIGIFGCIILLYMASVYYIKAIDYNRFNIEILSISILLSIWIMSGFFNPTLFSSGASVIFASIWALYKDSREPRINRSMSMG
jgi:hypothetical protein